jgi:hypothetical protein
MSGYKPPKPLMLYERDVAILRAALTELKIRQDRGTANSGFEPQTMDILWHARGLHYHESNIGELLTRVEKLA